MSEPVKVGLVGAGPWAQQVHGPMLDRCPAIDFVGVWARRPDAAQSLAAASNTQAFGDIDELYDACEAVSFAVPPAVQADLALRAAQRGKSLLLEKPIALDLAAAERLAGAVDQADVSSLVVFSFRFAPSVRRFLEEVAGADVLGGRGHFLAGSFRSGDFATPWRREHGPLLDLGPHVIDLLDAAVGPVVEVRAHGDPQRWIGLLLDHASGAVTEVSLTGWSGTQTSAGVELHTPDGVHELDSATSITEATFSTVATEFATAVRGRRPHPLDVHRGLRIQRLIDRALDDLRR